MAQLVAHPTLDFIQVRSQSGGHGIEPHTLGRCFGVPVPSSISPTETQFPHVECDINSSSCPLTQFPFCDPCEAAEGGDANKDWGSGACPALRPQLGGGGSERLHPAPWGCSKSPEPSQARGKSGSGSVSAFQVAPEGPGAT